MSDDQVGVQTDAAVWIDPVDQPSDSGDKGINEPLTQKEISEQTNVSDTNQHEEHSSPGTLVTDQHASSSSADDILRKQLGELLSERQKLERLASSESEAATDTTETGKGQTPAPLSFEDSEDEEENATYVEPISQTLLDPGLFSPESLTESERICIAGLVACLLYWDKQLDAAKKAKSAADMHIDNNIEEAYEKKQTTWHMAYFKGFITYINVPDSAAVGMLPLLNESVDPTPYMETLGRDWQTDSGALRILLLVLNYSTTSMVGLDARVQHQLRRLCEIVGKDWLWFLQQENRYARTITTAMLEEAAEGKKEGKSKSKWKIGLLAVGGGLALALTGGLAAPAIGAGMVSIGMGSAAVLTTSTGATFVATVFGVTGTALVGKKAQNRYKDIDEFEFERLDRNLEASVITTSSASASSASDSRSDSKGKDKGKGGDADQRRTDSHETIVSRKTETDKRKKETSKGKQDEHGEEKTKDTLDGIEDDLKAKSESTAMSLVICIDGWMYRNVDFRKKWLSLCMHAKSTDKEKSIKSKQSRKHAEQRTSETKTNNNISGNEQVEDKDSREDNDDDGDQKDAVWVEKTTKPDWLLDEVYCIRWESENLCFLGHAMSDFAAASLKSEGVRVVITQTVLRGLFAAVAWPLTVLSASSLIDNPWGVCMEKARLCGLVLADILSSYDHGHRPVTLVGYSMGARVIFFALEELARRAEEEEKEKEEEAAAMTRKEQEMSGGTPTTAHDSQANRASNKSGGIWGKFKSGVKKLDPFAHMKRERELERKEKEAKEKEERRKRKAERGIFDLESNGNIGDLQTFHSLRGIVLDVYLMGTPVSDDVHAWNKVRSVVAGRLVNCYSSSDWLLKFLYRTSNMTTRVAGLSGVSADLVENFDLTGIVDGHFQYPNKLTQIFNLIKVRHMAPKDACNILVKEAE